MRKEYAGGESGFVLSVGARPRQQEGSAAQAEKGAFGARRGNRGTAASVYVMAGLCRRSGAALAPL